MLVLCSAEDVEDYEREAGEEAGEICRARAGGLEREAGNAEGKAGRGVVFCPRQAVHYARFRQISLNFAKCRQFVDLCCCLMALP